MLYNYSVDLETDEHFIIVLQFLGKHVNVRQQVIATAIVYFKRFYTRNAFSRCDPLLVAPTCFYMATKIEECVIPLKLIVREMDLVARNFDFPQGFSYKTEAAIECEFYILEELDCYLIVYHPYRPLIQYMSDAGLKAYLQFAWLIVNDSYRTELCLLYPPHITALAVIHIIYVTYESDIKSDVRQWFASLNVDLSEVLEVVASLLEMYRTWNDYQPWRTHEILAKLTKSWQKERESKRQDTL